MIKSFTFFKKKHFAKQFQFHGMNLRFYFYDTTQNCSNVNTLEMLTLLLEPEKLIRELKTGCAELIRFSQTMKQIRGFNFIQITL